MVYWPFPPPLPLLPLLHHLRSIHQARVHGQVIPKAIRLPQGNQLHPPSPSSRVNHQHRVQQKSTPFHPSLYFGTPILNAYLEVARILQLAVQTPPTPPSHLPPNIDSIPSSLPRVRTPPLPRVNPPPLPRVTTSNPH